MAGKVWEYERDWFETKNFLIPKGDYSLETNTGKTKAGDGKTYYNDLTYSTVNFNYEGGVKTAKSFGAIAGAGDIFTLTTDGTSGASTLNTTTNTLNIPIYAVNGSGSGSGARIGGGRRVNGGGNQVRGGRRV